MAHVIPIPRNNVSVLRKEAHDARHGDEVIECPDIALAELFEESANEIEQLRAQIASLEGQLRKHGLTPNPDFAA